MSFDLKFELRYLLGDTPWDSGVSPPELLDFLATSQEGRAIEFGCGTGTNAITLARHGWQVDAIDLSWIAIKQARRKARRAEADIDFHRADVAKAIHLSSIKPPYNLGLDIGCFHALNPESRADYASQLPQLIGSNGTYLLYSFLDKGQPERRNWPKESAIINFHQANFKLIQMEHGHFRERPSAWFTFRRKS